ncbi:MAG: NUDIX hydrolase [Armatimonadota bacterium]
MDNMFEDLREKTIRSIWVFKGNLLNLRLDKVSQSDGRKASREVVEHPGAAAIVPVFAEGDVLLVHQWRQPIQKITLEIPAGTLDPGEDPEECARRELAEETGYEATQMHLLASMSLTPGYSTEIIHTYLATGLESVEPGRWKPDDDENLAMVTMPLSEAVSKCSKGEIHDGKTVAGLLMAWQRRHG